MDLYKLLKDELSSSRSSLSLKAIVGRDRVVAELSDIAVEYECVWDGGLYAAEKAGRLARGGSVFSSARVGDELCLR